MPRHEKSVNHFPQRAVDVRWHEALQDDRVARRLAFITQHLGRVSPADVLTAALEIWNATNEVGKYGAILISQGFEAEPQWDFDSVDAEHAKGGAL